MENSVSTSENTLASTAASQGSLRLNTIAYSAGSGKKAKRVGRGIGSGFGKTCGRGHKGQKSRSGGKVARGFEGGQMPLQRRLPKFGFTSRKSLYATQVTLAELDKVKDENVSLATLVAAGVINRNIRQVKIFLSGEVQGKKSIELGAIRISKGARTAVEAKGGVVHAAPEKAVYAKKVLNNGK